MTAAMDGLRAALIADAAVAALVADRVVDEPAPAIQFPYVRFGQITPVPDDTDGAEGARITVGLVVHSRPEMGRVEAAQICEAMKSALHRRPEVVPVPGFAVSDLEVQAWVVDRAGDGATYQGRLSLEIHLDD
jgi:hypothetical protein